MALDVDLLRTEIFKNARKYLKWYGDKKNFHFMFQKFLTELAEKYGYKGFKEYPLNKNTGRVDVAWLDNEKIILAAEIDSARKIKSIEKLININSEYTFWIYTGTCDPTEFLPNFGEYHVDTLYISNKEIKVIVA